MINLYKYYNVPEDLLSYNKFYHLILKITPTTTIEGHIIVDKWSSDDQEILAPIFHIIKRSPRYAYKYAKDVLCGRFLEAEEIIMKKPNYAVWYADDVMRGRWLEAEPYIKTSITWWYTYCASYGVPNGDGTCRLVDKNVRI